MHTVTLLCCGLGARQKRREANELINWGVAGGGGGAQDKACRHRRFQGLKYSSGLMRRPPSCRP